MATQAMQPQALEKLRTLGGEALVSRVVALFLELGPQRLGDGRRAMASGDLPTAERCFHSLRSSAANVGAVEVSRLAAVLEEEARRGEADPDELLVALEGELESALVWLRTVAQARVEPARPDSGGLGAGSQFS